MKRNLTAGVLKTGLFAGVLDIFFAFANAWWSSGVTPDRVLRFIASGLIGTRAFAGGLATALLGLALHFAISFFWTAAFFLLYPKLSGIIRRKSLQAILYGMMIWGIMNWIVLPVSRVPDSDFSWSAALKGMAILIIALGFPLAHFSGKYWEDSRGQK